MQYCTEYNRKKKKEKKSTGGTQRRYLTTCIYGFGRFYSVERSYFNGSTEMGRRVLTSSRFFQDVIIMYIQSTYTESGK